jgi:hypothetical protein
LLGKLRRRKLLVVSRSLLRFGQDPKLHNQQSNGSRLGRKE